MQVEAPPASLFPSLSESLPLKTLRPSPKPKPLVIVPESPTVGIPELPKNAYGLESFADYCTAIKRVQAGLPAIEAVTPPDRRKPVVIQGLTFKYWDPNVSESELSESDTDSETTALHPARVQSENVRSTWSGASPRKSILRQSASSLLVRESAGSLPDEAKSRLVYDYASSASPASRRTSHHSSRRISIDAGVQSDPIEVPKEHDEVVRVAAAKRLSARRSIIVPVKRGNFVHGLAGFTGVGRADSGAVICVANGKKFELVVDQYDRDGGTEVAVQCSGFEIDSEMEALFTGNNTEVIDVDADDDVEGAEKQTGESRETLEKEIVQDNGGQRLRSMMQDDIGSGEEGKDVPSPELLRSNSIVFATPKTATVPNLDGIPGTTFRDSEKKTTGVMTPTHLSLRSDALETTRDDLLQSELVATTAHVSKNRLFSQPSTPPKARVSAPPRILLSESTRHAPNSKPQQSSPETAPPAVAPVGLPQSTPLASVKELQSARIHAVASPIKTAPHSATRGVVRHDSFSFKPADGVPPVTRFEPMLHAQDGTLQLSAVTGVDIRPSVSAYQLAAMATLSPKSYLRAVQPQQNRVMFTWASPGGTAPVQGVNVVPKSFVSTPPVATMVVPPDSAARASFAAAPRRSQVSIARTEQRTPGHDPRLVNKAHRMLGSSTNTQHVELETEVLATPTPLQDSARNEGGKSSVASKPSRRTVKREKRTASSRTGSERNRMSVSGALSQKMEAKQANFDEDEEDDFDGLPDIGPDMDDELMEVEPEIREKAELQAEPEMPSEAIRTHNQKASAPDSRVHASRRIEESVYTERRRSLHSTKIAEDTRDRSYDVEFVAEQHDEKLDIMNLDLEEEDIAHSGDGGNENFTKKRTVSKKTRKSGTFTKHTRKDGRNTIKGRGQKRWRELKSLPTHQVNLNENSEESGLRRSKRQRFPRLKFWKNETVSYERRLSQAIPTIAEVIVEVGDSESDDDTWFGRR